MINSPEVISSGNLKILVVDSVCHAFLSSVCSVSGSASSATSGFMGKGVPLEMSLTHGNRNML